MDAVAYLISFKTEKNTLMQEKKTEVKRHVFCEKSGIKRAEFAAGGQKGLKPEFMLTVSDIDYHGESEVVVDGVRYGIYRTYPAPDSLDYIELYCEKKGGVQP